MSILIPGKTTRTPSGKYPIHARSGWLIPQPEEFIPIKTVEELRIKAKQRVEWQKDAGLGLGLELRSVSPYPYNCVGMIFASRRAIIEIDHIYDILREDYYSQISLENVKVGDIVLYKKGDEPSHVGMVTTIVGKIGQIPSIKVLSKWGFEGEFEHFMDAVPSMYGRPMEYYTERQQ